MIGFVSKVAMEVFLAVFYLCPPIKSIGMLMQNQLQKIPLHIE